MCRIIAFLAVLLAMPGAVAAQTRPQSPLLHLRYTGSALGLDVMHLEAGVSLDRAGYQLDISFRTTGLLAVFVRSNIASTAQGDWRGERAEPRQFWTWGQLRGEPRETLIDYRNGDPLIRRLTPPNAGERDEVPEPARPGSIDTLSAIAFLVHQVADTGNCDGSTRVFDGRRLSSITAHTVGLVQPARGSTGPWHGEALRCDFQGQQLAGFMHDGDSAWAHRPHNGSAWLARVVPGGPPVPVRLTFETRWVGDVTLILDEAGPGPLPQAAK